MNWLDVLLLITMAVPTALGLRAGLFRAVTGLGAIAIGTLLATLLWRQAAGVIGIFITDDNLAALSGYLLVIALVILIGWAAAVLVKGLLTILMLGWVDKAGGVVLGALIGAIISGALLWSFESFSGAPLNDVLEASLLRPYFDVLVPILRSVSGEIDLP